MSRCGFDPPIRIGGIEAWGRLEGTAWTKGRPAIDREYCLALGTPHADASLTLEAFTARTVADGHFVFPRVPPGSVLVQHLRPATVPADAPMRVPVTVATATVPPGATVRLELGKTDRVVVVRPRLPDGLPQALAFAVISTPIPQPPAGLRTNPAAAVRWQRSPEVQAALRVARMFPLTRSEDGSWRADEVTPGQYILRAAAGQPGVDPQTTGAPARVFETAIEISDGPVGIVLDLGEVTLRPL